MGMIAGLLGGAANASQPEIQYIQKKSSESRESRYFRRNVYWAEIVFHGKISGFSGCSGWFQLAVV